ncbi:transformation system, predicted amidophosphoribosyltransferase CtsW [Campylobacter pinnipediorum subsp. pinnipediorum]|uniref:ComF family protein n=1 Tax=Campylobacter pinnipediorum TaxID=1965231 RepID=UPI0009952844|nr:ComF family protein [Campylobacter pinnipediorum]AQW81822.1 transformation system, predicted amidophosphoribosyltransferase CtsW [Campylobacter pinnipediorum subsp. pinnipediorum]
MRCFKCGAFTIFTFCKVCSKFLYNPTISIREIDGFKIYSFYNYSEIKDLIISKHKIHGRYIFNNLAKLSFEKFAINFKSQALINAIPIDDKNTDGYSHTAILAKSLNSKQIKPLFHTLHSTNNITYSGKDLKFRKNNPRNFKLLKNIKNPVILIDDIVTTGSTIMEAKNFLEKNGVNVLCAIVLSDARY